MKYGLKEKPKKLFIITLILVVLVSVLLLLTYLGYVFFVRASREIQVTNITPTSATVIWVSEIAEPGSALAFEYEAPEYQFGPIGSDGVAYDDRDYAKAELNAAVNSQRAAVRKGDNINSKDLDYSVKVKSLGRYKVHHVTFRDLKPGTTYEILLGDGYLYKSSRDGARYTITTRKEYDDQTNVPYPAYGLVKESNGATFSDGVFGMYVTDKDGRILTDEITTPLAENGSWYLDMNSLYTPSGDPFLTTVTQEELDLMKEYHQVITDGGLYYQELSTIFDTPAPVFILQEALYFEYIKTGTNALLEKLTSPIFARILEEDEPPGFGGNAQSPPGNSERNYGEEIPNRYNYPEHHSAPRDTEPKTPPPPRSEPKEPWGQTDPEPSENEPEDDSYEAEESVDYNETDPPDLDSGDDDEDPNDDNSKWANRTKNTEKTPPSEPPPPKTNKSPSGFAGLGDDEEDGNKHPPKLACCLGKNGSYSVRIHGCPAGYRDLGPRSPHECKGDSGKGSENGEEHAEEDHPPEPPGVHCCLNKGKQYVRVKTNGGCPWGGEPVSPNKCEKGSPGTKSGAKKPKDAPTDVVPAEQVDCEENRDEVSQCNEDPNANRGLKYTLAQLLPKVFAQEDEEGEILFDPVNQLYTFKEDGKYYLLFEGEVYEVKITDGDADVIIYIDENENGVFDVDIDKIISEEPVRLEISRDSSASNYEISEGFNFISFDFVPDEGGSLATDYLNYLNSLYEDYDEPFYSISTYTTGGWKIIGSREGESYGSEDFQIVPGRGYMLRSKYDVELNVSGFKVDEPVPVFFSEGWNLVALHGATEGYTAEEWIDSVKEGSNLVPDNVTRWDSSRGRYDGLQKETDENEVDSVYGFDFPIMEQSSYFVRVVSGDGSWTPE